MTYRPDKLVLQAAIERARQHPERVFMTQPVNGQAIDYTWGETMEQARRMAAHLRSLDLPDRKSVV